MRDARKAVSLGSLSERTPGTMFADLECQWYVYDNSHRTLLGACLVVFGVCGFLLNSWLFITFLHSHLLTFKSHILVLNLCCASLGRNILGGFPFYGSSALASRWLFGEQCCQLFAFFNQFQGVFQMLALTTLCFERYLQAKYFKLEKQISLKWYALVTLLCWAGAGVWAAPPLAGLGAFACDVSRAACLLDWAPGGRRARFNAPLAIFAGVLPVALLVWSLWKAFILERTTQMASEHLFEQRMLTKSVTVTAALTLLFWTPQGVLAGWIVVPHFVWGYRLQPPLALAVLAPLASEAATAIPVLSYLLLDTRLRTALLGRVRKNYGIIRNKSRRTSNFSQLN